METKSRTRRDQNHWLPKKYSQAVMLTLNTKLNTDTDLITEMEHNVTQVVY